MIEASRLSEMERELRGLMAAHLGVNKPSLAAGLRSIGRGLPLRQRQNGARLTEALEKVSHPQLCVQLDEAAIVKAHGRLNAYLEKIDRNEVKRRQWIRAGSALAFNLLIVLTVLIVVLRLRGFI